MLLERGAAIDARGQSDRTALHMAIVAKRIEPVRFLLEHGADVNVRDDAGETPSQLASSKGFREIVELLSAYGAESV